MPRNIQWYGWKPDLPDMRDFRFTASRAVLEALPPKVDLSVQCPAVYDQGALGSCTANAIGGAFQFEQMKQDASKAFMPARLFIYYNERKIEGTINEDSGAYIRDGMKSVAQQGVCPETLWAYDVNVFKNEPSELCYTDALNHQVLEYLRVERSLSQMKGCLAAGFPFVFGFTVYDSFESQGVASSGVLNMPTPNENVCGGHAVLAVGYDDASQRFIVRNSWGSDWGKNGYFTMPYEYLMNGDLADDFWTIRTVEMDPNHVEPVPGPTPNPMPEPDNKWPCDWAFSATKAFVDGAVSHASSRCKSTTDGMIEAGLRGLQEHMQRVEAVRARRK